MSGQLNYTIEGAMDSRLTENGGRREFVQGADNLLDGRGGRGCLPGRKRDVREDREKERFCEAGDVEQLRDSTDIAR